MSLKRNIFANYLGTGTIVLAPILALPCYLLELGPKQFGLIGFIATLQALLGLLDAGMSQVLLHEIAVRFDHTNNGRSRAAHLLIGFERVYWFFALLIGCVVILLADTIATHWLNLNGLPVATGRYAIYGAAAIFVAQFPGSIYRSLLVGAQAQVALNGIMIAGALLRHTGGVVMVLIWPSLLTYLIWHVAIALIETYVRGYFAWSVLQLKRSQVTWNVEQLRPLWPMVAGMSVSTLLGALTLQVDRIVLSYMVSIEQFGYYAIAATVAMGSLQLIHPLTQALLPRAIQFRNDPVRLRSLSIKLMGSIALLIGLAFIIFATIGRWLLEVWLRSPEAVNVIYPLLTILLIGTVLNAFYNVGYLNWLVHKKIQRVFQVNALSLVLSVLLIPPLVSSLGIKGAATGWLAINLIGFIFSLEWIKR